jgi:peptidoglycan/xylan/chitin deacetylase (PgdA/CDA1 family)
MLRLRGHRSTRALCAGALALAGVGSLAWGGRSSRASSLAIDHAVGAVDGGGVLPDGDAGDAGDAGVQRLVPVRIDAPSDARSPMALPVPSGVVGALGVAFTPAVAFLPVPGASGGVVLEHVPFEPATRYTLELVWPGGAGGSGTGWGEASGVGVARAASEAVEASVTFTTAPVLEAVAVGPEGFGAGARGAVWARFGVDPDRAAVERSFALAPSAVGALDWPSARTLRFRPAARRAWGTAYEATVGGASADGAAISERKWSFRTSVPPPARIVPGEGKPVVLTFDDGSRTGAEVSALLDILRAHEARAILFPTGWWAARHPALIERARREGHLICNHTATHPNLSTLGEDEIAREIEGGAGRGTCDLLRPPKMGTSPRVERVAARLGYRIYLWDVDSRDWEGLPADDIANLVLARVKPGAVVLFHMHAAHTREALPAVLTALSRAGYRLTYEGADGVPAPPSAEPAWGGDHDGAP